MNHDLIDKVAWVGRRELRGPVRGIVLRFQGLGSSGKSGEDRFDLEVGDAGALVVSPHHDPWAWMNAATVDFVDELVAALTAQMALAEDLPVLSTGGSMGGHGALAFTLFTRRPVVACSALFPVCDLLYHYSERTDLPKTMHAALADYGDITATLTERSPLHQAARMPDIPYLFIHGEKDTAVAKAHHSDRMVAALREHGRNVEYWEDPEMGHGGPKTLAIERRMTDFVLEHLHS